MSNLIEGMSPTIGDVLRFKQANAGKRYGEIHHVSVTVHAIEPDDSGDNITTIKNFEPDGSVTFTNISTEYNWADFHGPGAEAAAWYCYILIVRALYDEDNTCMSFGSPLNPHNAIYSRKSNKFGGHMYEIKDDEAGRYYTVQLYTRYDYI